jgi:hypothetical protein
LISEKHVHRIIDIGGRARSGLSRKHAFPGKEVLIADICRAPDVDIVADVHEISSHVDSCFDAFICISTFEHLLMPWKAAVEINSILRQGGVGLVVTHQALGFHDLPWDFYRYSDQSWKGIFNVYTGFEIVETSMTSPAMIIPACWQEEYDQAEKALGFMNSACIVRKVGIPSVDWQVDIKSIMDKVYNAGAVSDDLPN